jgi:hypothetical protein
MMMPKALPVTSSPINTRLYPVDGSLDGIGNGEHIQW